MNRTPDRRKKGPPPPGGAERGFRGAQFRARGPGRLRNPPTSAFCQGCPMSLLPDCPKKGLPPLGGEARSARGAQ